MKDHRQIGKELELFLFNEVAPGAVFWLPKGMELIKQLENWLRELYQKEDILEVSTPILVNRKLWEQSGHWEKFKENMFVLKDGEQEFALKPMNCPEATLIYQSRVRSYQDLPLRLAEIGRLHRREVSGSLGGLFRVRQMTMDDLHIFCTPDQIHLEIKSILRQVQKFHKLFNFTDSEYFLATQPEKAMGEPKLWKDAQQSLKIALEQSGVKYQIKEKDGAFYGPKIDVNVKDSQGREWTLSTVQLDFNIPERFELKYTDADGKIKQPLIIHRAIFGTFERFIGILLEHTQGALPIWLSPVQVKLLPVSDRFLDHSKSIAKKLESKNIRVEIDQGNQSVSYKVRQAKLRKVPFYAVIGQKEKDNQTLALTNRDTDETMEVTIDKAIEIVTNSLSLLA